MPHILRKIFKEAKVSYLPALILAVVSFYFFAVRELPLNETYILNAGFYLLSVLNVVLLFAINRTTPFFAVLWTFTAYLAINRLKVLFGTEFDVQGQFSMICLLLPLNWIVFMLWEDTRLNTQSNFYLVCVLLGEWIIVENMHLENFAQMSSLVTPLTWMFALITAWFLSGYRNGIKATGLFYALASLGFGVYYAQYPAALSLFFFAANLILLITLGHEFIYSYFRDSLTGVYSRRSYYKHAAKSFPLKYSIGVICIDDYAKLLKVFGRGKANMLTKMIVQKFRDAETGAEIYRYNDDEFILVFKNEDKKQSYEYLETIRRSVAGAEFAISRKKAIKLTISAGVSEKKRSDADVEAVLSRTREALQKTYKFTQNITSKA